MALKKKSAVSPTAEKTVNDTETAGQAATKTAAKAPVEKKAVPKKKAAAPAPEANEAPDVIEAKAETVVEAKPEVITQTVTQEVDTSTGEVSDVAILPANENQQLAVPAQTEIATTTQTKGIRAQGEQAGFGGLDAGFGSFPILKLSGESFELDDDDYPEKEVYMQITQSRSKFIIKQKDQGDDAEFIYSYEDIKKNPLATDVSGSSVKAWIDKQHLDGFEIEVKEYIEAIAELLDDNEFNGEIVLLSIPPSGVRRFAGYCIKLNMKHQCFPDKVITVASIGKKIKKDTKSWCPWVFKFHSMLDAE